MLIVMGTIFSRSQKESGMDNKEKIALIKAGTDIEAIRDNMFLLSNRVRILEAAQKNGETPVTIDNKAMLQSLCGSCKKKRGCRCHYKFGVEAIKCKYYD